MAEEKKQTDWERIELDFRAGVKSIREIAAEHGITDTAIRKRAKRDSWARDLSGKITAKADEMVRRAEVREEVRAKLAANEVEVVEANALAIATVKLAHRADIRRYRTLLSQLLDELDAQTDGLPLYEELGELMRAPDESGMDRLNDAYRKVIGLPQRTKVMKDLADTLKTLITLERESYGIVDAQKLEIDASLQIGKITRTIVDPK